MASSSTCWPARVSIPVDVMRAVGRLGKRLAATSRTLQARYEGLVREEGELDRRLRELRERIERLRARINEIDPGKTDDQQLPPVSVSIGIAEFKSGDSLEDLIAAADAAMYAAKHDGRNCVRIATQA